MVLSTRPDGMRPGGYLLPGIAHAPVECLNPRLKRSYQCPEACRVAVFQGVAKLMDQHVAHQFPWQKQQFAIQTDNTALGTTSPAGQPLRHSLDYPPGCVPPPQSSR